MQSLAKPDQWLDPLMVVTAPDYFVQEVERTYLSKLNVNEVFSAIREAVALHHALQVYAIALIKPASIPKTSSGKIQRHACCHAFLTKTLTIVGQWQQNQL